MVNPGLPYENPNPNLIPTEVEPNVEEHNQEEGQASVEPNAVAQPVREDTNAMTPMMG